MKNTLIFVTLILLTSITDAATIYVNVHNVNGNLIQDAYVELWDSNWNQVIKSGYTNSSGMVTFALLDYGTFNY